jgi:hypothetical protein
MVRPVKAVNHKYPCVQWKYQPVNAVDTNSQIIVRIIQIPRHTGWTQKVLGCLSRWYTDMGQEMFTYFTGTGKILQQKSVRVTVPFSGSPNPLCLNGK